MMTSDNNSRRERERDYTTVLKITQAECGTPSQVLFVSWCMRKALRVKSEGLVVRRTSTSFNVYVCSTKLASGCEVLLTNQLSDESSLVLRLELRGQRLPLNNSSVV